MIAALQSGALKWSERSEGNRAECLFLHQYAATRFDLRHRLMPTVKPPLFFAIFVILCG